MLLYNDVEFKAHFRLKRETFFALLAEIENTGIVPTPENSANVGGRQPVALDKNLLVTLWYSANQCCIRDVSDRFNVTKSSVKRITKRVLIAIKSLANEVIVKALW